MTEDYVVVLPGDNLTKEVRLITKTVSTETSNTSENAPITPIRVGVGVRYDEKTEQYFATCAGRLERKRTRDFITVFVQQNIQKRYRPYIEDRVVGIVEDRGGSDGVGGDLYKINIQASHPAFLSNLSFEGASKRNKPSLQIGQVLYARVVASPAAAENDEKKYETTHETFFDPITLSCINGPHDESLPRKDWMTSEGAYGELRGGTVCQISLPLARELLIPNCVVLKELSKNPMIQFEVAVGVNGLLWINSVRPEYTVLIQNAIQNSAVMTSEQVRSMVKTLVYNVEKSIQQAKDASS